MSLWLRLRLVCSSVSPSLLIAARVIATAAAGAAITAVGVGVGVNDGAVILLVVQQTDDLGRSAEMGAEAALALAFARSFHLTRHAHVARCSDRCSCWS